MCSKIKFILTKNLQPVVGSAIQMYNHPPPVMILMIGNKFFATKNHCLCLGLFCSLECSALLQLTIPAYQKRPHATHWTRLCTT